MLELGQYVLSPEPVLGRTPLDLYSVLSKLWKNHFGGQRVRIFHKLLFVTILDEYQPYHYQRGQIALALEHLTQLGAVATNSRLFDPHGRFLRDVSADTLRVAIFEEALLKGIRVGVVGGPEGRVFAEMGAETIGLDPQIGNAPKIDLPNLDELQKSLTPALARQYSGRFDLTYSARVFDSGSGLVRYDSGFQYMNEYAYYLQLVAQMTKPDGISIHNGDMLPSSLDLNNDLSVREVVSPLKGDKLDSSTIFVLQRTL